MHSWRLPIKQTPILTKDVLSKLAIILVLRPKPVINGIFKIKKQLNSDNQDVVGDKCVKDDTCNLSIDNKTQKVAWKQHYECLLNE